MPSQRQHEQRIMWSIATEMFGRNDAEGVLHAHIILTTGKTSVTHLTDEELEDVITWLKMLSEAAS